MTDMKMEVNYAACAPLVLARFRQLDSKDWLVKRSSVFRSILEHGIANACQLFGNIVVLNVVMHVLYMLS